jgi:Condensation domain
MSLKNKNIEDAYPLSPMQQGMLFHSIYAPNSGVYVEQMCFELHGALNVSAFIQAWQQVIIRHPVLRIACVWENLEKPLQVVAPKWFRAFTSSTNTFYSDSFGRENLSFLLEPSPSIT